MIALTIASAAAYAADPDDGTSGAALSLELGAGIGWAGSSDNGLRLYDDYARIPELHDREAGVAVHLGFGYGLTENVALGVDLRAWSRRADDDLAAARLDLIETVVAVTWHPWRTGPFARLGYGLGAARLDYLERGSWHDMYDTGACYLLAIGHDLRLGRTLTLAPQLAHVAFATRDLEVWVSSTCLTLALCIQPGRSP